MTQNVKNGGKSSLVGGSLGALALIVGGLLLGALGCSEGEGASVCDESACQSGQRCVQNECRDACRGDADCPSEQMCRGYEFQPGDVGSYCVVLPGSKPGGKGRFTPCADSSECDEAHGFSCIEGECAYECSSHNDCAAIGHCDVKLVDGERKQLCVRDETPPVPRELYTSCPQGDECSQPSLCLGAGPGDLDAHCSVDCDTDDDCGLGYYCGSVARAPCADACDVKGQPSDPRCAPVEQIGAGKPFQCGPRGPERQVCRKREFCAPCDTDADCLGTPNQVCARDESGEKICTRLCDTDARSCPWGNAARCAVFDDELGLPTCSHRFGSCRGTGETCEPCTSDSDCPSGVCAASAFTGERWCINLTTRCECPSGAGSSGTCLNGGCPDSPSGLPLLCVGERSSGLFNTCYAANAANDGGAIGASSPQIGCWGP